LAPFKFMKIPAGSATPLASGLWARKQGGDRLDKVVANLADQNQRNHAGFIEVFLTQPEAATPHRKRAYFRN
jgi:hypothetical protein